MSPNDAQIAILADLFTQSESLGNGTSAKRFRVQHRDVRQDIDSLVTTGLVESDAPEDLYRLRLLALPHLPSNVAGRVPQAIEQVYRYLAEHYVNEQEAPLLLSSLADAVKLSRPLVNDCVALLKTAPVWRSCSNDLAAEDAAISMNEAVLDHESVDALVRWLQAIADKPKSAPTKPKGKRPHGNAVIHAQKREQVLGAALAVVAAFPDQCKRGMWFNGKRIAALIETKAPLWFEDGEPPLDTGTMASLINGYLNTTKPTGK